MFSQANDLISRKIRVITKSGNNEIQRRIHIAIVYEKVGGMDEEQTAFRQLNLSDFKL